MRSAYYRVALTYWQRVASSPVAALVAVMYALMFLFVSVTFFNTAAGADANPGGRRWMLVGALCVLHGLAFYVGRHVHEQLSHTGMAIIPAFGRYHFTVGVVASITAGTILSLLLAQAAGWSYVNAVCLGLLWGVASLRTGFRGPSTPGPVLALVMLLCLWRTGEMILAMLAGDVAPVVCVSALLLSLLLLAELVVKIAQRRLPTYEPYRPPTDDGPVEARQTGAMSRWWRSQHRACMSYLHEPGDWHFTDIRSLPVATIRARAWRWRLAGSGSLPLFVGVATLTVFLPFCALVDQDPASVASLHSAGAFFLPVALAHRGWRERRPMLGWELLRPNSRREFLLLVGWALAKTQLAWWVAMQLLAVVVLPLLAPQVCGPAFIVSLTVVLTAMQVTAFGLWTWLLSLRSPWQHLYLAALVYLLVVLPMIISVAAGPAIGPVAFSCVTFTLIGVLLTRFGYRVWWRTEFA